ncbi:MAG TPA: hypothetical protein VGR39_07630 [Candidatus Acidoferrales bacterium]|nr:hypothetical protein [Candidatus Acidoferrales bacterium]
MNAFFEHHQDSIRLEYRCFDRLLLNGLIQPFQQPERVIGFFNTYREGKRVTRDLLREIADQYKNWVTNRSQKWKAPILEAPKGRRDNFMDAYFQRAKADEVVAILRAREPARILIANGNKKEDRWHLQLAQRWVIQYNFYINDARWGRMFVRVCPYFPFSARVCLNQHYWLANRMREERIHFQQCSNAFSMCSDAKRLQELSDSLSARDLLTCGQKWQASCTPFFTEHERKQAGCQHRLFFAQVEYCDNLIFERRAALDALGERLLDANRTIGQPNKITTIFGRKVTKRYGGKLQTVIEDLDLPNPVIRSHYGNGFIKQYVRDHLNLRTEPATNDVTDYGVKKAVENLPQLREKMTSIVDRYHDIQQDILETFVDRGQLRKLAESTILSSGKRVPGLKLDHPRQLALMHALVRFAHIATASPFTTQQIYPYALEALGTSADKYSLASLRYDMSKLRAKGLTYKVPKSRRHRLTTQGYSVCLVFLKLFERIYAPLTAGLLQPVKSDSKLQQQKRSQLDRLYQRIVDDLDQLLKAVGLKTAA